MDAPEYRRLLGERLRAGNLSPAVECMLWYYAKGKPREEVLTDGHLIISWQGEEEGR